MRVEHLYIHVPFCARRCVYCDFSIAVRSRVPVDEFLRALASEWNVRHRDSTFSLSTLYLGGGTPSKLGGDGVARLMDLVRERAAVRPDAEVTLEANPEDVSEETARAWRRAGINRISLGVQSFDDNVLRWMHRTHDAKTAGSAIKALREGGFDNISIDLIFAAPDALSRSWERDLDSALGFELPHLSVYGLTVEPHTPLGRWVARSDVAEAPEENFEREYLRAHESLIGAGLEHYEVSNYGRRESHSRHNWAYWNRSPYGGLGPSAHEFDGRTRRWNTAPYADWVTRALSPADTLEGREELSAAQSAAEETYLNLRTSRGITLTRNEREHVAPWVDMGWATVGTDERLRLTGSGWLRLDSLANDLTLVRSH